jgi:hypothetical protein
MESGEKLDILFQGKWKKDYFKFGLHEDCDRVLEGGPWLFEGRVIVLRRWNPEKKV